MAFSYKWVHSTHQLICLQTKGVTTLQTIIWWTNSCMKNSCLLRIIMMTESNFTALVDDKSALVHVIIMVWYQTDISKDVKFLQSINAVLSQNDWWLSARLRWFNSLRPRQNGRRFADDTFKRIFLNENVRISIKISLKFVPKGPINNNPALVQIMAWRRPGDKPLSESMLVRLPTHICVTRPQWVNTLGLL